MSSTSEKSYCAFCRTERRVYKKKGISLINIIGAALAATVTMLLIWRGFNVRMIPIFVLYLATSEVLIQLRWRFSIACPACGFDPVLYLNDRQRASQKVKAHLERRKNSPSILLSRNAKLDLPYRKAADNTQTPSAGLAKPSANAPEQVGETPVPQAKSPEGPLV